MKKGINYSKKLFEKEINLNENNLVITYKLKAFIKFIKPNHFISFVYLNNEANESDEILLEYNDLENGLIKRIINPGKNEFFDNGFPQVMIYLNC